MGIYELSVGLVALAFMWTLHLWQRRANTADFLATLRTPLRFGLHYVLLIGILIFGEFNVTEFIYFQF
jgi:hypothetical protein